MSSQLPSATLPGGYLLRRMRAADASQTAELHRRLLPNGLFPRLGPRFLRRWHVTFLDTPSAMGLTVVHHGEVVAFVLASVDQRLYLQHTLRRHRLALMWRGALGLLVRPHVLAHFLRTRVRAYARHLLPGGKRRAPTAGSPARGPITDRRTRVAVVHAVVTAEHARGQGLARALLDLVTQAARRACADHVALVTDVTDPARGEPATGAAAMYEALGWQRVDERRHRDGRWIAEYRYPLVAGPASTADPRAVTNRSA